MQSNWIESIASIDKIVYFYSPWECIHVDERQNYYVLLTSIVNITIVFKRWGIDFSRPIRFMMPKAQKGIDKGEKSTRFWEQSIVGWKYTWAQKST